MSKRGGFPGGASFGGMNINKLMKEAKKMQADMEKSQEELTAKEFDVPASGTMAHSWIQSFDSEYEAFKTYAEIYPTGCTFLVDTYDTLNSGIPNAIKIFDEILKPQNIRPVAIRLDSGDLAYLSKKARKMLDDAGYQDCKICATNSLDEFCSQTCP